MCSEWYRYDMFNVKLHKGYVVDKARRRYYQMDLTDNPINDGQVFTVPSYPQSLLSNTMARKWHFPSDSSASPIIK